MKSIAHRAKSIEHPDVHRDALRSTLGVYPDSGGAPGFTLMELVISSFLVALIGLAVYEVFTTGLKLWGRTYTVGMHKEDVLISLERIARDVRSQLRFQGIGFNGGTDNLSFAALIPDFSDSSEPIYRPGRVRYYFNPATGQVLKSQTTYQQLVSIPSSNDSGVVFKELIGNVRGFNCDYYLYNTKENKWGWSNSCSGDTLPRAVRVSITIPKISAGRKTTTEEETITQIISLPLAQ